MSARPRATGCAAAASSTSPGGTHRPPAPDRGHCRRTARRCRHHPRRRERSDRHGSGPPRHRRPRLLHRPSRIRDSGAQRHRPRSQPQDYGLPACKPHRPMHGCSYNQTQTPPRVDLVTDYRLMASMRTDEGLILADPEFAVTTRLSPSSAVPSPATTSTSKRSRSGSASPNCAISPPRRNGGFTPSRLAEPRTADDHACQLA